MNYGDTPGERLRSARLLAGRTQANLFAEELGLSPVTYRAYENDQNGYAKRAPAFAAKLNTTAEWLLEGRGDPPAARRPETNATIVPMEGPSARRMHDDLPIFGTALGAPRIVDGEAIEQTTLNTGDVVQYAKRPIILEGRADAYGLYVQGHSMEPVHMAGDLVLAERKRPARVGDDVVVYLRPSSPEDDDGERASAVLIKRLVRRTSAFVELEQFNPPLTFRMPLETIVRMDRVPRLADLIA